MDSFLYPKALWHLDSFRELLLASHHTHAGHRPTRQHLPQGLVPPPAGTGVRVCAGRHSVGGDGGCGNDACRGGTLCVSNCTSKNHSTMLASYLYTLYTPFVHPLYTVVAAHAPMCTHYTCIYTIYTPLNTSKHPKYTLSALQQPIKQPIKPIK